MVWSLLSISIWMSKRLVVSHWQAIYQQQYAILLSINLFERFLVCLTLWYHFFFRLFFFSLICAQISWNGSCNDNRMRIKRWVPKNRQHHIFQYQSKSDKNNNSNSKTEHFPLLFSIVTRMPNTVWKKTIGKKDKLFT